MQASHPKPGTLHLTFHGAAGTVTGSCMQFATSQSRILVDCGLFQGSRTLETLNHGHFAFDPRQIDAVVLTHAHIDHCGLIPKLVREALTAGGNLVIPTFALERTQELVLDLIRLAEADRIPNVPIFVDSPLASEATSVFAHHAAELEDLEGVDIAHHPSIHYTQSVADSQHLNTLSGAIILAASGMCEAGRIRHHLRHNLHRRDSTILFVGFQAGGTLGRALVDGAQRVRLSGEDVMVRARIRRIDTYSAHADRDELHAWISQRQPITGTLFLSHGEPDAVAALRDLAQQDDPRLAVATPRIGELYELKPATKAKRLRTGRIDSKAGAFDWSGPDWQNDYAAFTANLKSELSRIRSPKARRRAIERMRQVLASAQAE